MEDLLKPRYKVTAIYPQSKMKVGEIIVPDRLDGTVNSFWVTTDKDDRKLIYATVENYPHLFRKMDWWEERRREEMPEYVKCIKTPDQIHFPGDIIAVKWDHAFCGFGNKGLIIVSTNCFIPATKDEFLTPATLSEYLEQITNKK